MRVITWSRAQLGPLIPPRIIQRGGIFLCMKPSFDKPFRDYNELIDKLIRDNKLLIH